MNRKQDCCGAQNVKPTGTMVSASYNSGIKYKRRNQSISVDDFGFLEKFLKGYSLKVSKEINRKVFFHIFSILCSLSLVERLFGIEFHRIITFSLSHFLLELHEISTGVARVKTVPRRPRPQRDCKIHILQLNVIWKFQYQLQPKAALFGRPQFL